MTYIAQCTCGMEMKADADTKDEAIAQLVGIMNPDAVKAHMEEKHVGDPIPSQDQVRQMIETTIHES